MADIENPYRSGSVTLTKAQYDAVRAFLDELKPGVYVKCSQCKRWGLNEGFQIHWTSGEQISLCERCAR